MNHSNPSNRFLLMTALVVIGFSVFVASVSHAQVPTQWDWRNAYGPNMVSGVRNQGACGSCYILMPLEMVESRQMIEAYRAGTYIPDINYSEQYIMSCGTGYFGDFGCGGGYPKDTLTFIQNVGVPYESCYEYTAMDASCPASCPDGEGELVLHQIPGPVEAQSGFPSESWIMEEIFFNGPVATQMDIYTDFQSYSSGIYQHVTGSMLGGKAMLIVGWGTEGGTDYWIIKNSWGEFWGENGYFRIVRGGQDNCDFGEWIYTATVGMPATAAPDLPAIPMVRELRVHPNPFNPRTVISFGVPEPGRVSLRVYDLSGRLVRVLLDDDLNATALHSVNWDGRDGQGRLVTSGVYLSRVLGPSLDASRKMALIR